MIRGTTELQDGVRIGKYLTVSELGRGGMGIVYLAEDTTLERLVALKVLHPSYSGDDEFLRRFENEAKSVAKLHHPHIVPINSFSVSDGQLVIEMPYFEGGSLGALLSSRGVYRAELLRIVSDTLDALRYCHREGIVHRDVKPMNVLLDNDGRAFLSDFGLAKVAQSQRTQAMSGQTSTGIFLGTPRYAPPEIWEGAPASPASDLYSLGVILYEGLSGQTLYKAETPLAYLKALAETDVAPLNQVCSDASEELTALVSDLTVKDPDVRLSSAEDALDRLRQTPEWGSADEGNTPTTVVRLDLSSRHKAPMRERLKNRIRQVGPWGGWSLAIVVVILAVVELLAGPEATPTAPAASSTGESGALAESTVAPGEIPDLATMISLPRFPSSEEAGVYEVYTAGSEAMGPSRWLLRRNAMGELAAALGMDPHRVLDLAVEEEPQGGLTFTGRWGGFIDGSATQVWHGTVEGHGRWLKSGRVFSATISLASEEYTARWDEHVSGARMGKLSNEFLTSGFLYDFEEADLLLPLVCNELMPRHDYWRTAMPEWLPAFAGAVCRPAALADEEQIRVDGAASENTWQRDDAGGVEAIALGWPRVASPEMRVLSSDTGLYILLQADTADDIGSVSFDLLADYRVPVAASTRYSVTFASGQLQEAAIRESGETRPWQPGWEFAETRATDRWTGEVHIPFTGLGMAAPPPPGALWRLSVLCTGGADGGPPATAMCWGAPVGADVLHGVLLAFGDSRP